MILVLLLAVAVLALVAANTLGWPRIPRRASPPRGSVSVLIPARNEEHRIGCVLESLREQSEPILEVLVYDDHSTDRTAERVWAAGRVDARIRLISPVPLPDGWYGKPFACARLAREARGDWFLFLDADARLEPGAVARIVAEAERRDVTFLSAWPGLEMHGFWEKTLMPLLNFVVFTLFPAPLSLQSDRPSLGLAHGVCILTRRAEYEAMGGHACVRADLFEDTALARAWRTAGLRGACLDGRDTVTVRMYDSLGGIWTGFQKNAFPAFRRELSFWMFLTFHFLVFVFPFVVAAASATAGVWNLPALGAVAAVWLARALQALRFQYPLWSVVLHPFAECALIAVSLVSWVRCRWGAGIDWKNRVYRGHGAA